MTKRELCEALEDVPDNAEVRIAVQQSWPFLNKLQNVCIKLNDNGEPIGAVIAAGDNEEYTSKVWWSEYDVMVDENGDPIEDEEE